jgi:hypothetical protein
MSTTRNTMTRTSILVSRWAISTSLVFCSYHSPGRSNRPFRASQYTPTTRPCSRAPHVFLLDGSSIFDNFGMDWSLATFTDQSAYSAQLLLDAASSLSIPIKHIDLRAEHHAHSIWERDIVLVRPDEHVAWRANSIGSTDEAQHVMRLVIGLGVEKGDADRRDSEAGFPDQILTATSEMKTQVHHYALE